MSALLEQTLERWVTLSPATHLRADWGRGDEGLLELGEDGPADRGSPGATPREWGCRPCASVSRPAQSQEIMSWSRPRDCS